MVEQHVEEVAELGRDAAVLQGVKISVGTHVGMNINNQTNKNVWKSQCCCFGRGQLISLLSV